MTALSPAPAADVDDRRRRRVRQLAAAALIAMLASVIGTLAAGQIADLPPMATGGVLIAASWWLARTGRTDAATWLLLGCLTAMMCALVWRNGGVRDSGVMAFPAIMLFAALLGSGRLLAMVWASSLLCLSGVVVATAQGWRVQKPLPAFGIDALVDVVAILSVSAFGIWLMTTDLLRALADQRRENARARESESRAAHMACHDALTGLPNRALVRERFAAGAALATRRSGVLGLLYLDLDRFKSVNDALGQRAGDALLRRIGERLVDVVRRSDTVARTGGDEFVLLLELPREDAADVIARQVLERLALPFAVDGIDVTTGASIGIALYPRDGHDFDALMRRADTAMYRAKDAGRGTWRHFDATMDAHVGDQLRLAAAMRTGLDRGEFELHYQPQIELASGAVVGVEALIRWRHPQRGLVPPGSFIPVAEQCGLIVPIGEWVLRQACRQAAAWARAGLGEAWMAVNVSPVQFRRGDLDRVVADALAASGLAPGRLEIELTESLLIDDSPVIDTTVERLQRLGVTLSIDDFGTGYSNMAYLRRLRVQRLKIDRSFVSAVTTDAQDDAIVRAIVQMSHGLGLSTVAEGIEDDATRERLTAMGCAIGQGFHWSRPLPAAEFEAFLRARDPAAMRSRGTVAEDALTAH